VAIFGYYPGIRVQVLRRIIKNLSQNSRDSDRVSGEYKSVVRFLAGVFAVFLSQCFPTRVPRNPRVPQNIVRGSTRNREINI
jgi:hypothetical protein